MSAIVWLNTVPRPGTNHERGHDHGQRGWRFHAVPGHESETLEAVKNRRAMCGLRPSYGWHIDLFMNEEAKCSRCLKALGKKQ